MREFSVAVSCDKTYAETGEREQASRLGVTIALGRRVRELDLTDGMYDELAKALEPWLAAGHVPGTQMDLPETGKAPASRGSTMKASRKYNEGMRAFADREGINYTTAETGKFYYTRDLRDRYAAYLAEEGGPGAREGREL